MNSDSDSPVVQNALSGNDNELIFNAPWEARAFAIVNQLAANDHCTWPEWTQYLIDEISVTEQAAPGSKTYYEQWVTACEKLLTAKGILDNRAIEARIAELMAEREAEHQH